MSAAVEAAGEIRPFHAELTQDANRRPTAAFGATRWRRKELATYVVEREKPFLVLVE